MHVTRRNNARLKIIQITADFIALSLRGMSRPVWSPHYRIEGLPKDAQFLDMYFDPAISCLVILVASETFEEVGEHEQIPEMPLTIRAWDCGTQPEDAAGQ